MLGRRDSDCLFLYSFNCSTISCEFKFQRGKNITQKGIFSSNNCLDFLRVLLAASNALIYLLPL